MAKFDNFIGTLKQETQKLAKLHLGELETAAVKDADAFVAKQRDDLKRWTKLLKDQAISEEDFVDLLNAKKALAEMIALRKAGLSLIKLERFRQGFLNLIIDTAFDTFIPG